MNGAVQRTLIGAYSLVNRTGVLKTKPFKRLFRTSYFAYKRFLEDPLVALVAAAPNVCRGGLVIDVGANLGYTSLLFSKHIDSGRSVIAFEPDRGNHQVLCEVVAKRKEIVPVWAAVGEVDGEVQFWTNPGHHADSRTVTNAFEQKLEASQSVYTVPLVSVDSYLRLNHSGANVALIKIDVQGYEEKVLRGCEETLTANPNVVVAFEFSPDAARELGFDPEFQLAFFRDRGFNLFSLSRRDGLRAFNREEINSLVRERGYCDIVASRSALV